MFLLAPSSFKQLGDRLNWFKHPSARRLFEEKGVEFGFELKGDPETITEAPPLYWGYHLPDYFATEWHYHPEKRKELVSRLSKFSALSPKYVNIHGAHLWWQPPSSEYIQRYANRSEPEEYFKIIDSNIELLHAIKEALPNIVITQENYPLYGYYRKEDKWLPETYLYTGTGRLNDLLYIKEKTGIDILLDVEHMILTLNFLNRERNYKHLPIEKGKTSRIADTHSKNTCIEDRDTCIDGGDIVRASEESRELKNLFGFVIEKDIIPYADPKIDLGDVIKKIGAKYYHVTGSVQDCIPGEKILTHEPIKKDDKVFRESFKMVLAQKPESILNEVVSSLDDPAWHYLRPNETELSFYNLCEILLEEL